MSELYALINTHRVLESAGVTPKAFVLLAIACDEPYLSAKELFDKYPAIFSRNSFTRMGLELAEKGLLTLQPKPGKLTGTAYVPTGLGLKFVKDAYKFIGGSVSEWPLNEFE